MTVTTVYSSADGNVWSTDATYATARAGGTMQATAGPATVYCGQATGYTCYQSVLAFDTSSIPDDDVVSDVSLEMMLSNDLSTTNLVVQARTHSWGGTADTGDWVAGASLSALTLLATLSTNGIGATGSYKTFTSETAFASAIVLTGSTEVMLSSDRQAAGTTPTNNEYVRFHATAAAGTTQDPKLTITHEAAPTTTQAQVI